MLKALGGRLKKARTQAGLTQGQVGKLIHKVASSLSHWENGEREISILELMQLADLYSVSPQWLLTGVGEMLETELDDLMKKVAHLPLDDFHQIVDLMVMTYRKMSDQNVLEPLIGKRVIIIQTKVDNYGIVVAYAGETGEVVDQMHDQLWLIKLDKLHSTLRAPFKRSNFVLEESGYAV